MAQSWDDLNRNYRILFPNQEVSCLAFGGVFRETDVEENNEYVLQGCRDRKQGCRGLLVTRPDWYADRLTLALTLGFVGIKPYPDLAVRDTQEMSIFEFCPPVHLKTLNDHSGVLMLHLPRAGRLGDPENIAELLEISQKYPNIKMIVAHVGRSFCLPTAQEGLPAFVDCPSIYFDTSANLNSDVFQYAVETIGPDRLLFGSDLPITMMRGMREHVGDKYINYTDAPYSWNTNRKSPEDEAKYTFYLYEEIKAIIQAAARSGLGRDAVEKIMYSNSARLFGL